MLNRLWPGLLAAAVACAISSPPAAAQALRLRESLTARRPSHVQLPGGGVSPDAVDEFFRNRLEQAEGLRELEKLAEEIVKDPERYGLTPEDLRKLQGRNFDLKDPELQKTLDRVVGEQSGQGIDPEKAERWQELIRRYGDRPAPPDPPSPSDPPGPGPKPPVTQPDPPGPGPKPPVTQPGGDARPPSQQPAPPRTDTKTNERLRDLASHLQDTPLGDSKAMREAVLGFDRIKPRESSFNWRGRRKALEERFADWDHLLPEGASWPKIDWSARDLSRGRGRGPDPSGDLPPPPDAGAGGAFRVALLVGAAALAAAVLWAVLRRAGGRLLRRAGDGWRLGPWPVRPEAVRTRDELVRAFEYLSLLLLGPASRAWNHRDIAFAIGVGDEGRAGRRRDEADRLADLYEQARYAPGDEPLSEQHLAEARRALCFLAGVSAA
jgi:hypothetical protein